MNKSLITSLVSAFACPCANVRKDNIIPNPSRRNSCFLAMRQFLPRVVAFFLLVMLSGGVWGATYYAKVNVTINPSGAGTVSGGDTKSQKSYEKQVTITFTLTPTANSGYEFDYWDLGKGNKSYDNPLSFEVTTKKTDSTKPEEGKVTAVFKKKASTFYYSIQAAISSDSPSGCGSVTPSTTQTGSVQTSETSGSSTDIVTATPNSGYEFVGWSTANNETSYITGAGATYEHTINNISGTSSSSPNPQVVLYAHFRQLPLVYFSATAVAVPSGGGTVSASVSNSSKRASSSTNPSATTEATYTVTATNTGYTFTGWSDTQDGQIVSTSTTYTKTITATSTTSSSPTDTKAYAHFMSEPTDITVSPQTMELAVGGSQKITTTLTPENAYEHITYASSSTSVATVAADGTVTGVAAGTATITVNAYKSDNTTVADSKTVSVTVMEQVATPEISFEPSTSDNGATATATITCATDGATIYYTINGDAPTPPASAKKNGRKFLTTPTGSQIYDQPFTVGNGDEVKAIAVKSGNYISSLTAAKLYSPKKVPTPTINMSKGQVTFSCEEPGVTFYYTTDGTTTPTAAETTTCFKWNGTTPITGQNEKNIQVIAVKTGFGNSSVATQLYIAGSGTSGTTVILNDYEDHNWKYYAGVDEDDDPTLGGEKYNTKYRDYMYSPDPRNVKITYKGVDLSGELGINVAVSASESENKFVYYETLEKYVPGEYTDEKMNATGATGHDGLPDNSGLTTDAAKAEWYPYTVISNPFSKRPKDGSTYYGFNGWKVTKGWAHIRREDGNVATENAVLKLDENIHFIDLDDGYVPNCTSAEIEFEATWAEAEVLEGSSMPTFTKNYSYERSFWIINGNIANAITVGQACTVTGMSPDGGATINHYNGTTNYTINAGITADTHNVKFEWVKMNTTGNIDAHGYNFTMGRGIVNSQTTNNIYGCEANKECVHTFKVESGKYAHFFNISNSNNISAGTKIRQIMVLGCDYDRARANVLKNTADNVANDDEYTNKLQFTTEMRVSQYQRAYNREAGEFYLRGTVKSGNYYTGLSAGVNGGSYNGKGGTQNMYVHATQNKGFRYFIFEGGYFNGGITGGSEGETAQPNSKSLALRIRGDVRLNGFIAGGADSQKASGHRIVIMTGGTIGGWVAAGSNGTETTNGDVNGKSFVYVGGNVKIDSHLYTSNPVRMGHSTGGAVYGTGSGTGTTSNSGQMTQGTNVVVADDAYVERGVYGGGAFGYVPQISGAIKDDQSSNIYILGGHVGGKKGSIYNQNNTTYTPIEVQGGVYGGACYRSGCYANVYMLDGLVETGVYGGSNADGTMSNDVNVIINGGQVGMDATYTANVHGGGYGNATRVLGSVNVAVGSRNATTGAVSGDAVIYGDVYGGSAEGKVNGNTSLTSGATTTVTLNSGTINGSLYGGGLGTSSYAADVYGPVQVNVYGGKVKATSAAGSGAVYGCNNVNGAPQSTVKVDIYGTDAHNNGANATDTSDDIYAINAVYGGGNQANYTYTATNDIYPKVTVHNCNNSIQYVYGGGNQATVPGTEVKILGGNIIGNVFGGGNNANVTTNGTNVTINGGRILNVYGGNNNGGSITGNIKVTVEENVSGCGVNIDDLYGGGNKAASQAASISIGKCTNITRVFGGANQANVTGNITLNITDGHIQNVFGGNNNSGNITGAITVNVEWGSDASTAPTAYLGNVYGGGNIASYSAYGYNTDGSPKTSGDKVAGPTVNIKNATTDGSVFGGGKGKDAVVYGDPVVNIGQWGSGEVIIGGDVFGGGDLAAVEGNPSVTIRDCDTEIDGNLYGGGNAAPVYSTNTTMWGGTVLGNVFGGGNGVNLDPTTGNPNGAQVGYKNGDSEEGGTGDAVTKIYGGTIGTWTTDATTGVSTCSDDTGGIFGGSNTNGNIRGAINLELDEQECSEANAEPCSLKLKEVYGAGNQAGYAGTGITFKLGCVSVMDEIYGGAKAADLNSDVHLKITSGHFTRVFGGNNLSGKLNGSIKVTIDETGCHPVIIDELYGGGNEAPYSIYGYEANLGANGKPVPLTALPSGSTENPKADPVVNIISCTHIGQVFGGGYGATAIMVGNPTVNIQQIPGIYDPDGTYDETSNRWPSNTNNKLGTIGTVFGGGNAAKVVGNTNVNIGTDATSAHLTSPTTTIKPGANITGNVYGGGSEADVTGKTHVQVGPTPTTTTP